MMKLFRVFLHDNSFTFTVKAKTLANAWVLAEERFKTNEIKEVKEV